MNPLALSIFNVLLLGLPCAVLVVAGIILTRNWRAKESHTVWVVGVALVVLGQR